MNALITGVEELKNKLEKMSNVEWEQLKLKQAQDLKKRSDVVTPYRTGKLRRSATYEGDEFGYTVDYADDVNYGHRTKGGGYVEGRHFLEEIVNAQEEIYREDVLGYIRENK